MPDLDKSFITTMMHLVKVWDVSLCKKKNVVPCLLSQLRKRELNYLTSYLKLSIMEHVSNVFLEVKVTFRRIIRIYSTSSLSWS